MIDALKCVLTPQVNKQGELRFRNKHNLMLHVPMASLLGLQKVKLQLIRDHLRITSYRKKIVEFGINIVK